MLRKAAVSDLQMYSCFSFSGGLDIQTTPAKVALLKSQDRLRESTHTVYATDGSVSKRLDVYEFNATACDGGVTGGVQYRKSTGLREVIVGTNNGSLYRLNYDQSITQLATGLSTGTDWWFATYNDDLIITNRVDAVRKYDGTTVSLLGGSPPSKAWCPVVHANRVWMLSHADGDKSTAFFCALDDHEDWTTADNAGSVIVNANDGEELTGMLETFNGELLLQKPNNLYRVQGSTFAELTVLPIGVGLGVGGIASQAMVSAANNAYFLGYEGIYSLRGVQNFGSLSSSLISLPIDPYFTPNTPYTLALALLPQTRAAYDRPNNRLYYSVPAR